MEELRMDLVELSYKLLEREFFYTKLPPDSQKKDLVNFAIKIGKEQGMKSMKDGLSKNNPSQYIKKFCRINYIAAKPPIPIYSEIEIKKKVINIYTNEIKHILHDLGKELSINKNRLYNLFVLHEFFHLLEYMELGLVSRMKKVSVFNFFSWEFKRGIPALSEIAAHAYAREITNDFITYISC